MQNNVVAHFNDGKIVKGTSLDALPGNPKYHFGTKDDGVVEVLYRHLKALYFVKELDGNHEYRDVQEPEDGDARLRGSKQIRLRFRAGEEMVGSSNAFPPTRSFFFTMPISKSNNVPVLVNRDAVSSMQQRAK
jgi:hypothetical protein